MPSKLKVLKSNAGYYIGRTSINEDFGFEEPYSRESGYFRTLEEAELELKYYRWEEKNSYM